MNRSKKGGWIIEIGAFRYLKIECASKAISWFFFFISSPTGLHPPERQGLRGGQDGDGSHRVQGRGQPARGQLQVSTEDGLTFERDELFLQNFL